MIPELVAVRDNGITPFTYMAGANFINTKLNHQTDGRVREKKNVAYSVVCVFKIECRKLRAIYSAFCIMMESNVGLGLIFFFHFVCCKPILTSLKIMVKRREERKKQPLRSCVYVLIVD